MRGEVYSFDPTKSYGWITAGPGKLILAHANDVLPDGVGRKFLRPCCPVEFELGSGSRGGLRALRICDISAATAAIGPGAYQEVGLVHKWDTSQRCGFATRPDGDTIFVSCYDLTTIGEEDLSNGQTWIRYRIGSRVLSGKSVCYAREVEILEPDYASPEPAYVPEAGSIEEQFLNAAELPVETSAPTEPQIYGPEERKLSLRELIRRKNAA